jgi:tRNA pseudouridine38-40 synthase
MASSFVSTREIAKLNLRTVPKATELLYVRATSMQKIARRFKAVVSYDGTRYAGYQVQPNEHTIQAEIEGALERLTGTKIRIYSSGRTDSGVHARGQVIHFDVATLIPLRKMQVALNRMMHADVRIESLRVVPAEFDARFSAKEKEYRYFIWNGPVRNPHVRLYRAQVRQPLDLRAMNRAAKLLVGKMDFAAFSANPRREVDGTVRHLRTLRVRRISPSEFEIVAKGDGFLYKMVRSLAGFLIRVGTGEIPPGEAERILASKKRTAEVPTAAPEGLFLWRVRY